jgi:hypothetical protein
MKNILEAYESIYKSKEETTPQNVEPTPENDVKPLRSVKVFYDDGNVVSTSISSDATDEDINNYYKVGRSFNIGSGEDDKIAKVQRVVIDSPSTTNIQ